jgi:hypothetical protein
MSFARDRLRSFVPSVAGLTAAVQQQNGRAAVSKHVGDKFVAGSADKGPGGGYGVRSHDIRCESLHHIAPMEYRNLFRTHALQRTGSIADYKVMYC